MKKKYYYKKEFQNKKNIHGSKKATRFSGLVLLFIGTSILLYYSAPVIVWQIFFTSVFATVTAPVPPPFILTRDLINEIKINQKNNIQPANDKNKSDENWISTYHFKKNTVPSVGSYTITIPKLKITNAIVSTIDPDLSKHLVQYWGTPLPPLQGNTIIFGHSTFPQLFNANNYRTIFANANNLRIGDEILVRINNKVYAYKIIKTYITDPDNLSVLNQEVEGSYLTIITCTPPGTTWKRLIIKTELIK
jgi:sortase A